MMKKSLWQTGVILLFTIMLSLQLTAQSTVFVSLNGGLSVPVLKFASNNPEDGSFANPGVSFGGEAVWYFRPHWGVGIEANVNNNPLDVSALTQEKLNEDPFLEELSIRAESFRTTTVTAGVYGKYPLNSRFSLGGKIMAGWIRCETAYQLYRTQYYQVGPTYYEITSSRDDAFLVVPGVGITYLFPRGIGFKLEGEYVSKQMAFPFQTSQGLVNKERQVSYFQVMLGLVIGI